MKRIKCLAILLSALALAFALAGVAQAATYTINGTAYFPDGSPAGGVNLILCAHTGRGLDRDNTYWKIPSYDYHPVTTAANGTFTMTNVQDYVQNTTHRYIVLCDGPSPFYHCTVHVLLDAATTKTVRVDLKAATSLRLRLTDAAGSPFNGTRAVFMQSGTLGQGPMKGISFIRTANFVNGVAELPRVVIKDKSFFYGRIGVLKQATAEEVAATGVEMYDSDEALRLYVERSTSTQTPLNHIASLVESGYTDLTYSLQ